MPYVAELDLAGCESRTVYLDQDGDGYGDPGTAMRACNAPDDAIQDGSDCDDADAGISPAAEAICADAVDNNCDGAPDCPALEGRVHLDEASAVMVDQVDGSAGEGMHIGDFSGDGLNDYLLAADYAVEDGHRGRIYVVQGPVSGEIDLTSDDVPDISSDAVNIDGHWSASGDLDGDGYLDILSASADSNKNIVFLASGPFGDHDVQLDTEASAYLTQTYDDDDGQGDTHIATGDVLGDDGQDDLLFDRGWVVDEIAAAFFVAGPLPSEGEFTEIADAALYTLWDGERDGFWRVDIVGDIDGDGISDVSASTGGDYVFVIYELPLGESEAFDLADVTIYGEGESIGSQLVSPGDVDGDGLDDLLILRNDPDDIYWGTGDTAFLFSSGALNHGASAGTLDLEGDALAIFDSSGQLGMGVGKPGDMNRDGYAEVFLGDPDDYIGEDDNTGYASLWYGPVEGDYAGMSGDIVIKGDELGSRTGWRVAASPGDDRNNPVLLVGTWPFFGASTVYQFTPDGY